LKIKNWTSFTQDRNNWKIYIEKAKTFNVELVPPKKKKRQFQRKSSETLRENFHIQLEILWYKTQFIKSFYA